MLPSLDQALSFAKPGEQFRHFWDIGFLLPVNVGVHLLKRLPIQSFRNVMASIILQMAHTSRSLVRGGKINTIFA